MNSSDVISASTPSPARMYDFMLGGKDNFAADREAVQKLRERYPVIDVLARANRRFHQRAAAWMARHGISQFLDIGCGLPTMDNTHGAVRAVTPGARVVYADNDRQVVAHARALLAKGNGGIIAIEGDFRQPESILGNPGLRGVLNLDEPCGLLLTAVLHFISDSDHPHELVARYMGALAPGSYLALTHGTEDKIGAGKVTQAYEGATANAYSRSVADITRFFDGLELVPPVPGMAPGIAPAEMWAGDSSAREPAQEPGTEALYAGIARKP